MGSVPVVLHETPYVGGHVHAYIGDPSPLEPGGTGYTGPGEVQVWPDFTIRQRTRSGFTDEGAPVYEWTGVLAGETMLFTARRETDPDAGVTRITGKATIANPDGLTELHETATATDTDGHTWRVTQSEVYPTHIVLTLDRVEFADTGEVTVPTEPFVPLDLVLPDEPFAFSFGGELAARSGVSNYPITGGSFTIASIAASLDLPPVGGPTVVDLLVNGVSLFPTPEDRPTFTSGSTWATVGAWNPVTLSDGDVVSVNVVTVASGYAGADLVLAGRLHRVT